MISSNSFARTDRLEKDVLLYEQHVFLYISLHALLKRFSQIYNGSESCSVLSRYLFSPITFIHWAIINLGIKIFFPINDMYI